MPVALLEADSCEFPAVEQADDDLGGLLAVGGDLSVERLKCAYSSGIFPWYSEGDPLLWWSPPQRCIIEPEQFHCSRSLYKKVRKGGFYLRYNSCFETVVSNCARRGTVTRNQDSTWILPAMRRAYQALHHRGIAHSVELWDDQQLVAGLYGVQVGALFCGESMYSDIRDGSKLLLYYFCQDLSGAGFSALDCQISNPHLLSLGATTESRQQFIARLSAASQLDRAWPPQAEADNLTQ